MKYAIVNGTQVVYGDLDYNYHPAGAVIVEHEDFTSEQILELGELQVLARSAGYTMEEIAAVKIGDAIDFPSPINLTTEQLDSITSPEVASLTTAQV